MTDKKTRYQILLEKVASDPALKSQVLNATAEQFLSLCKEKGLELDMERATELQKQIKAAFDPVSGQLTSEQLRNVAAGVGVCVWNCYSTNCYDC